MAFYLSNLLQKAYDRLGQSNYSTATGGTTNTVVDSKQVGLHTDNAWVNAACFITRDAGGASAAPEDEFAFLTGYTDSSGTFTAAASAYTTAPAAGDTYMFANDFYPIYTMIELANAALQALGPIALIDTSTTSAANTTEYDWPVALKRRPPLRIDYQTSDTADNYQYREVHNWRAEPAAAGSTGIIVLPQLPSGRTVRMWYVGVHPALTAYHDAVSETIEPELATLMLVEKALEWQNTRLQGGDDFLLQRWSDAKQQVVAARAMYPIWKPKRKSGLLIIDDYAGTDEFTAPS